MSNFKIKFNLHNWKMISDMKIELDDDSNLYLIKGANNSGKTSILQAILALLTVNNYVPQPLKDGEQHGLVEGEIPGPDGKYLIKMDVSEKGTTFQMFNPQGMRISRVGDMRAVFEYNSMTTEDFIKKSYSTGGRREQIKILASLLDIDDKLEFETLLANIDQRKGRLFIDRKAAKGEYDNLQSQLKLNDVSLEDQKLYNESSKVDEYLKQLRERESVIGNIPSKSEELEMLNFEFNENEIGHKKQKENLEFDVKSIDGEVGQLEERLEQLKRRKIEKQGQIIKVNTDIISLRSDYEKNVTATNLREDTADELVNLKDEINTIEESRSKVLRIGGRIDVFNELKEKEDDVREKHNIAETKLNDARNNLLKIIKKISIPGYDLTIEDDTIFIDGYPLNEHQVADSKLIIAVSAILAKVNHKSPILVVGKLAELDDESLRKLDDVAKDNNCIIIGDYVSNANSEIVVEGVINEKTDVEDVKSKVNVIEPKNNNVDEI